MDKKIDWNRREFIGAGVAAASARAQEVGMGARRGGRERLEAPYTLQIETPHVKWANPLPGGPIRLLAVPTVSEGRTAVELAQRLSLELTTVSIDPAWDVNKWTMCFGSEYGARAERGDLRLIYSYLEEELTGNKQFDAVLLPLNHGWVRLTSRSREALVRRVREGCGLVLVRPFASELSPLTPLEAPPAHEDELEEPREPGRTESSPWRRAAEHYITRAVPVESFPSHHPQQYLCRVADAEVLIASEAGRPILAVGSRGRGRVAAFAYRNAGLSWHMPMDARYDFVDVYWEYFYALLCRALIWVARREPSPPPDWSGAEVAWRVRNRFGGIELSGYGARPQFQLKPGRYFLELQSGAEWEISAMDVAAEDHIEQLAVKPDTIGEGDTVTVQWQPARPARIELLDGSGRVIGRQEGSGSAGVKVERPPLSHSGCVRATMGTAVKQVPIRLASSSREWNDYEVMLPWCGPRSYQPWISTLDEQFRRIGITTLSRTDRNFKLMVSAHLPGFGIYWYRRQKYLERKAAYAKTGDKKFLTRDVTLQSPEFEAGLRERLAKEVRRLAPLKPVAYYLADESSLTCYTDPFDVDWAPEALDGFRRWLRSRYGSLERVNSDWDTRFPNWDQLVPMTAGEAQRHGNFAPWADHREYMEEEFIRAFELARRLLREIDSEARASISGTQVPTAHNGCNWYEIDQRLDYIQPYSGGGQDAMHHLFNSKLLLTGFTGYGLTGAEAHEQVWRRLFYGHCGASIFWHYTLLNPDLAFSKQGEALAAAFGKIQSGIGRLFQNAPVREDGVAIHFSMASIRGAWITDGVIAAEMENVQKSSKNFAELMKRRDAWVRALERQGLQFRFLATPQIEAGALRDYKVLILPYSIAISDAEAREIERFLERGGELYADGETGRMDERCRWRQQPLWTGARKGLRRQGPGDLGLKPAVEVAGEFLVTVRDFGASRLIGLLPEKPAAVDLPRLEGVVYDLLRGGPAGQTAQASPEMPILLLVRRKRIARLELDDGLLLRLSEEDGNPVDRSVVHCEVFDPSGELVRHYTANVTIVDGTGRFSVPWALNDGPSRWRVRARDVISGLTAEQLLT
jgi:hypothetical protein